jgi:hypothetical protein
MERLGIGDWAMRALTHTFKRCFRWFGADTVLLTVAMQGLFSKQYTPLILIDFLGLSSMVGLVYAVDRWWDYNATSDRTPRHTPFQYLPNGYYVGLMTLAIITAHWWWQLPTAMQWGYLAIFGGFILHILGLLCRPYRQQKAPVVGTLFTLGMILPHMYTMPWSTILILWLYTQLNLQFHHHIEHPAQPYPYGAETLLSLSIVGIVLIAPTPGIHGHLWLLGIFLQWMMPHVSRQTPHWYAYGELFFAIPFIMGYFLYQ